MPKFLQRTIRLKTLLLIGLTLLVVLLASGYWLRAELQQQLRAWYLGSIEVAGEKYIRFLPDVDRIVLCAIERISEDSNSQPEYRSSWDSSAHVISKTVTLEGEKAEEFVGLWRCLWPYWAVTGLCHEPAQVIRFYHQDKLILETECCWKCGNISVPVLHGTALTGFDRKTKYAKALSKLMEEYIPGKVVEGTNSVDLIKPI